MAVTNSVALALSDEQRNRLEGWLVAFEQSWHAGRLDECVRDLPPAGELRAAALVEMVKIDLERGWRLGRPTTVETYLARYPELLTPDGAPADLIQAEFEARLQTGVAVDIDAFARRFPSQAGRLRQLLADSINPTQPVPAPAHGTGVLSPSTLAGATPGSPPALPERFGRYLIRRRLGQGGMGTVYLAHDTVLDLEVALKVPRPAGDSSPDFVGRFYREARAAAALRHPNLCRVYDAGQVNGVHFLAMDYVAGTPLSELIRSRGPWPEGEAVALARRVALALDAAHVKEVVHRDLKPANVLVRADGEPVVVDFGLARRAAPGDARLTQSGTVLGTPGYMPPEVVRGDVSSHGPACDVYSLGVVLYELLTGRLPFEGSPPEVMSQILTSEPPRPSSLRPGLSSQLEEVVMKAMAKRIGDRYGRMAELADALGRAAVRPGRPTSAWPPQPAPGKRSKRPRVGRPVLIALGLLAALVVAAGVLIIRIKGKDGKEKTIEVPEGSTITVTYNGGEKPAEVGRVSNKPALAGAEKGDGDKPLATEKHKTGLLVDVTQIKRTSDGFLNIRWRYRNPTDKDVLLFDAVNYGIENWHNRGESVLDSLYFVDPTTKKKHTIVRDEKNNLLAIKFTTTRTTVKARGEEAFWAKFAPPADRAKVITLYLQDTPPFEDLPLPGAKAPDTPR
jgi:hypothetical protein